MFFSPDAKELEDQVAKPHFFHDAAPKIHLFDFRFFMPCADHIKP